MVDLPTCRMEVQARFAQHRMALGRFPLYFLVGLLVLCVFEGIQVFALPFNVTASNLTGLSTLESTLLGLACLFACLTSGWTGGTNHPIPCMDYWRACRQQNISALFI